MEDKVKFSYTQEILSTLSGTKALNYDLTQEEGRAEYEHLFLEGKG